MLNTISPPSRWCYAPSVALYFDPWGNVYPCCAGRLPFGRIGPGHKGSLREIWNGAVRASVLAAVTVADLSEGCAECAQAVESAGRSSSLAVHFDRWESSVSDLPLDLEFALSNTCNLQCAMCNGMLSSSIRAQREHLPPLPRVYDDRFFDELAELLPDVRRVAFKGGEPFLAAEARRVMDLLIDHGSTAEVKVTTNGTVWTDRVEEYLRKLRVEPIVSIDAMDPKVLESVRVGLRADRLWQNIARIEEVAREVGRQMTFSYCLMPTTWKELAPLLVEAESRGASVTVAHVSQPERHSLLGLEPGDLARIRSAMGAQEAQFDELRPENRTAWDHALAWVDHCTDLRTEVRRGAEVEVEVKGRFGSFYPQSKSEPSAPDEAVSDGDLSELHRWSGADLIVVRAMDGKVFDVTMPLWAAAWDPEFLRRPLQDLPWNLAQMVGEELELCIDGPGTASLVNLDNEVVVRARYTSDGNHIQAYLAVSPATKVRVTGLKV